MTAFFYDEQRMAEVLLSESVYRLMLCGECSSELFYCAAGGGKLLSAGRTFHCNKAPAYANERQAQLTQHRQRRDRAGNDRVETFAQLAPLTAEFLGSSAYSAKSVEPETVCALSDICYLFCGAVECGYSQVGTDYRERQGGKASSGPDVANGAALRQIRRDGCGIGEVLCYYLIKAADGGDVQPTALVEHIAEQYIKPLLRLLREQLSEPCLVKAPPQRRKKALSVGQRRQLSYFFFCTHMYLRCRVFESGASESEI